MFICYPTIYDMPMLALASYMKILIEWKHFVYPDSILKAITYSGTLTKTGEIDRTSPQPRVSEHNAGRQQNNIEGQTVIWRSDRK
jgi:hypothetical protein